MHLIKGNIVKLLPKWSFSQSKAAPVWGGPFGYVTGMVEKVITHEHDATKHVAEIEWTNGERSSFPESALELATTDEANIALDYPTPMGPLDRDIWVLVRTSLGSFGLNCIECMPFGYKDNIVKYIAAFSHLALPTTDNSDYNLVASFISSPDFTECRVSTLYAAAQHIFQMWELPQLDALPLPLPNFGSVKEAAASAPGVGPAVLFFHLPRNLNDYSDYPSIKAVAS